MGIANHCTETNKVFVNTLGHIAIFLHHKKKLIYQSLIDTFPSEWVLFVKALKNKPERFPYFASIGAIGVAIVLDGTLSDSSNEVIEESSYIFFTGFLGSLFLLLAFFFLFALLFPNFGKDNRLNCTVYVCIFKITLTQQFFQCLVDGTHLTINSLPVFGSVKLIQTCSILIRFLPHITVNHNSRIDVLVNLRNTLPYSDEQCSLFTCAFSQKIVAHSIFLYKSSTKIWKDSEICHHIVTTFSKLA